MFQVCRCCFRLIMNSVLIVCRRTAMRRLMTVCLTAALAVSVASAQQPKKRRVAIMNFDYSTVSSYVAQIFGSNTDVGKGVADLLVEKLVKGGTFSVIERKAIDKIIAEQNFSNSDRA